MKKALALGILALSHFFFTPASAESTTIEPSLPDNLAAWEKRETPCDKHKGKHLVMTTYLLRGSGGVSVAITTVQLNEKKVVQAETLFKAREDSVEIMRAHVIDSQNASLQNWTKYEFLLGDSKVHADAKMLITLGLTKEQFAECNF